MLLYILREIMELCWHTIPRIQGQLATSYTPILQQCFFFPSIMLLFLPSSFLPSFPPSCYCRKCFPTSTLSLRQPDFIQQWLHISLCTRIKKAGISLLDQKLATNIIESVSLYPNSLRMDTTSYSSSTPAPLPSSNARHQDASHLNPHLLHSITAPGI